MIFDASALAYFDSLRRLGEWQEEHWEERLMPFDRALALFSDAREMFPESVAWAEQERDATGFSNLLKQLSLLRV